MPVVIRCLTQFNSVSWYENNISIIWIVLFPILFSGKLGVCYLLKVKELKDLVSKLQTDANH